jgi:hypothetical protein
MPLATEVKRKAAVEIVLVEEREKGWSAEPIKTWVGEKKFGCDILSTPPDGGEPQRVEVKGWGEPMLTPTGTFTYGQDIRASQFEAAKMAPNYRIEIVANLDAYLAGRGGYQRLTLKAEEIRTRAIPRLYDIPLDGLEGQVVEVDRPLAVADPTAKS